MLDFKNALFTDWQIYEWELIASDYVFYFALGFFLLELIRLFIKKQMKWNTLADSFSNFVTLAVHLLLVSVVGMFYLGVFYYFYKDFSFMYLPINYLTIILCIILADLTYYCEHRIAHRIGLGWATHTVHHSSPYFNISVAYRHGPLDFIFGLPFHIPLILLGFDPILVLFSASVVQLYQTLLHTEVIGKFPKFIETVMNTPSHHRVHHGSNPQYIDKNYAGILIIWDKFFGTFAEEDEKVVYGVLPAIKSVSPLVIFFHGFTRLFKKMGKTKGLSNKLGYLIMPPGWSPKIKHKD